MNIPNIFPHIQMHNHFSAAVKDADTGKVKQEATAYNVVLNTFYSNINAATNVGFNYIQIGTGTGQPRATDTTLFNRVYTLNNTQVRELISPDTLQITTVVSSPVGNTGDFTEVGFGNNGYLISHALFTDAEGNPIVIRQTETDLLEITGIAYINLNIINNVFEQHTYSSAIMDSLFSGLSVSNTIWPNRLGIGLATSIARDKVGPSDKFFNMHGIYAGLSSAAGTSLSSASLQSNEIARAGVTSGNYGFYNYLVMGLAASNGNRTTSPYPSSFVKFPNQAVFPLYTVENLSVGIGDGIRNNFNCPIDMFVKDSDVIRVNGVQLTRGIDYTIDHHSNHTGSINITPGCIAVCKADVQPLSTYMSRFKMFSTGVSYTTLEPFDAFSQNAPLYIELDDTDETIGITLNYIKIGGIRPVSVSNNDAMNGVVYTLEYSVDGNSYSVATTFTFEGAFTSSAVIRFPSITAKYWRLSIDVTGNRYYTAGTFTKDTLIVQTTSESTVLGYEGTGITFTNPPAADAVIEMDVAIDRPYKSQDFVIELAGSLSMSR